MDDPIPKKRGKKSACSNFYNCTFVGKNTRQVEAHKREYHDPEPLLIEGNDTKNASSNQPPVKIPRDPNREMLFSCLHPDCAHTSITRDSAGRHYRNCRLLHASSKAGPVVSISSAVLRRPEESTQQQTVELTQQQMGETTQRQPVEATQQQPVETTQQQPVETTQQQPVETRERQQVETVHQQSVQTTQQPPVETRERRLVEALQRRNPRQSPRLSQRHSPIILRRHNVDRRASSSLPTAPRSLPAGADSDHLPHRRTTTTTAASTTSSSGSTTSSSADATTTQLLAMMNHLTNAVAGLSKHLDKRAGRLEKMGEQMVWLADQLDDIRSYNTKLEVRTNSFRREMVMVERRMEDLVQDNRDVRRHMRGMRSDLGQLESASEGYR